MADLPKDPTAALFYRINQNIMALGCALEEISTWIDQRGSTETYERVSEHLQVLEDNADSITELMVQLITMAKPVDTDDPED